ncbi:hypothetical protein A2U01_0052007, partial [Trifolium medium]|nr:hypothetical protein [Trifolium medium]
MDTYDGSTDPDYHIENIEAVVGYRGVWGRLSAKLCRLLTAHFTASHRQPKTEATLEAIVQREGESPRTYIERFNKAAVEVKTDDIMKLYMLDRGLRQGSDFAKAVGIGEIKTLDVFLGKAQKYI